jgi:hypothetical protein
MQAKYNKIEQIVPQGRERRVLRRLAGLAMFRDLLPSINENDYHNGIHFRLVPPCGSLYLEY